MNDDSSHVLPRRRVRWERLLTGAKRPLFPFLAIAVLWLAGCIGLLLVAGGMELIYNQIEEEKDSHPENITATPPEATASDPSQNPGGDGLGLGIVTYDYSGQYAFPIAADPHMFTWTHYHWDGTHAADLEVRAEATYPEFVELINAELVAVTSGIALNYSGKVGGLGYMLHGDNGTDYYYAHMSQQYVPDGARVTVGQPLGVIGSTGGTAQFIEPHLHMSIGPRDSLWENPPTVNTAEWIQAQFGLGWQERRAVIIEPNQVQGWPVSHPAITIVTTFEQAVAQGLPQPALELSITQPVPPLDVIATLSGEVNVIRWTAHYGTRIQINNDPARTSVVISGVDEWLVQDGDVVSQGQVIGRWNPANRPKLHYMIYRDSVIIDPAPTLGPRGDPVPP